MAEHWKNQQYNTPTKNKGKNHYAQGTLGRGFASDDWAKEPKHSREAAKMPWLKWLGQVAASVLIFALIIGAFQGSDGPMVGQLRDSVRVWFTMDADLTPVMQYFGDVTFTEDSFDKAGYEVVKANAAVAQIHEDMVIPVAGKVVSTFGWQPASQSKNFNQGITIETTAGEQVKAAYAGTVLMVQENRTDYTIMLAHSNGLVTTYGRCGQVFVKADQVVEKGQVIGVTGLMPTEKGQLYFETKHLGEPIDPLVLLKSKEV